MKTKSEDNISSFDNLLKQIEETSNNIQREKGTLFEKLVLAYLKNEPTYKALYKNVWELRDVPNEFGLPDKKDKGVDLVAEQFNGDIIAIQAKFYRNTIGKSEINSFVAETGANYYQGGLIISTVDDWNKNAKSTIENNQKNIEILGLSDLRNSQINWSDFNFERPEELTIKEPKELRFYQKIALENAINHFKKYDRGQLIMAPGTGKTFTSLKISEALSKKTNKQFKVLYLVPSIQLLTQTLKGWNNDTELKIASMAVTSDRDASRGRDGTVDIKATDIGYPATTSKEQLLNNWKDVKETQSDRDMLVIFSTYQSIDVIGNAQKEGFPEFDLIISDEAHRTTGAHEMNKDASAFTKVHNNENVKGELRMYQTATPKIYGDNAKKNAKDKSILLSSMDDESKYGEVIYRMGFGQAVSHGILTDYKVMVLAVDETAIKKDMQKTLADLENGLDIDDVGRIVGIWNGMMRRNGYKNPIKNSPYDGAPLKRAIAFTKTIEDSKKVSKQFEEVVNEYIGASTDQQTTKLSMKHADGTMNALQKGEILDWLADPNKPSDEARIVSNVRFLTEGIDVPSLDAVIFLAPKKSQVDIVQAVGRIMRKSENKDYGYIILPVVIPAGETPETVLDNNKHYEAVWQIINALRSVDERFEAMVDKINIAKPKQLEVIGIDGPPSKGNDIENTGNGEPPTNEFQPTQLEFDWDQFESAIFGKIVQKVGDRKYLENWSADVAKIAQRQISWIKTKLEDKNDPIFIEFKKFVSSLKYNINNSIDENQAAEMLSQHLITKPIFEALFSEYSFVNNNPVSTSMENIVKELEKAGFAKEQENLAPLYESVKMRAEGVEKAEDKQKIIITLYDKFFSTAFKSTTERLGIVFTPIEVVDFIVKSVDDVLTKHFGKSLASDGVHILDPFTGTGTFIVRILEYLKEQMESGEISLADITRKFTQELHANEIILLSYYIAAINIESTFDEINGEEQGYIPFEGIVFTDTFEGIETENPLDDAYFGINDERLKRQQEEPITAIIGNPPYSAGQKNENDNNKNREYSLLDQAITNSYAKNASSKMIKSLYDSYFKAFRWATDRIGEKGVIAFVTNNSFIDKLSTDGFRKTIKNEFNTIYVLNLRGGIRGKTGEEARREGENIFDIMTGVAITILIKDDSEHSGIFYYDIGEFLSRADKLSKVNDYRDISNIDWVKIIPDENDDWINQRDKNYKKYISMYEDTCKSIFKYRTMGIVTNRDSWVYNFSKLDVINNSNRMVKNYNNEIVKFGEVSGKEKFDYTNKAESYIKWTRALKNKFLKGNKIEISTQNVTSAIYRPFTKKWLMYEKDIIESPRDFSDVFSGKENIAIMVTGAGSRKGFSCVVVDCIPNMDMLEKGQVFLHYTKKGSKKNDVISKTSNISEDFLIKSDLNEDDVMSYIYGVLHSTEYRERYTNDLIKETPRIPILSSKETYIAIGRNLIELHLEYENVEPYHNVKINGMNYQKFVDSYSGSYKVKKMKHPRKGELGTIIFNDSIIISDIPEIAYKYEVNGRPAIEWIIDQYCIKNNEKAEITDDPNEYSKDPKYIFNLLLSIITVSMKTLELIEDLPDFKVID
ncbi:helicase [Staphylococcus sp. AntiMn-1]|uniref:type ISP restriction/modification enzyme n=1 Tax=Staphylococcus sp. AntiMn-1 TaxID=1715860 RepID=UPI0007EC2CF5|nr:type ISP restriction/modification enzyme [Staphylococcus sp. AntiMn-1]ANK39356.1 helicase [Staphylococcus sp. AntiMn-1]